MYAGSVGARRAPMVRAAQVGDRRCPHRQRQLPSGWVYPAPNLEYSLGSVRPYFPSTRACVLLPTWHTHDTPAHSTSQHQNAMPLSSCPGMVPSHTTMHAAWHAVEHAIEHPAESGHVIDHAGASEHTIEYPATGMTSTVHRPCRWVCYLARPLCMHSAMLRSILPAMLPHICCVACC